MKKVISVILFVLLALLILALSYGYIRTILRSWSVGTL